MANSTYADIYTRVYYILGVRSTSTIFPLDTLVKPLINEVEKEVCRGTVTDEVNNKLIKAGDLRFLTKQMPITIVPTNSLAQATNDLDDNIYLNDASDFQQSGCVVILQTVISYTGKVGNKLVGCVGVIALPLGAGVRQVWEIPSNATYPFNLEYVQNTTTFNTFPNPYMNNFVKYRDYRAPKDLFFYFSIIGDNFSSNKYYLYINGYNGLTDRFILRYYTEAVPMVNDTDYSTLPDEWAMKITTAIVAGRLLRNTEEVGKATTTLRQGYKSTEAMFSYYSTRMKEFRPTVGTPSIRGYYQGTGGKRYVVNY